MSVVKKSWFHWRSLLLKNGLHYKWKNRSKKRTKPYFHFMGKAQAHLELLPYPIDILLLLASSNDALDEEEVPCKLNSVDIPASHNPTNIAQNALIYWNAYLADGEVKDKEKFMSYACWLLDYEMFLSHNAGGWPLPFALPIYYAPQPYLSALTQGNVISVFVRAYQLTKDETFLHAATRATRTFEADILDGGVNTPIDDNGIFFETVAVYPAAHILSGDILALLGLYEYVIITNDKRIEDLIQRNITALHTLFDEFDTGYWTRYDLLHKRLASRFYHSLHVTLIEALAKYSGCEHCAALAQRWSGYQHSFKCCLHYLLTGLATGYFDSKLKPVLHRLAFRANDAKSQALSNHICIPITEFPSAGGVRGVLAGIAQVMEDQWQILYLTHRKGKQADGLKIEVFGRKFASPWNFPSVWLYYLAGLAKLITLLRLSPRYILILPQDGIFTGAFAALAGKMAGIRVVCMDHGNVTELDNPTIYKEWISRFQRYPWHIRLISRSLVPYYELSLRLLTKLATRCTDHFLIAGDEVEEVYRKRLSVHPSRITRYIYMIDIARFTLLDKESKMVLRMEQGLPEEAIIITLINRLALEKGLHFALEGISLALTALPSDLRKRVRVLIAGDGPFRSQVEADIRHYDLSSICILLGEADPSDVVTYLGISDIFLYSGTRGTNYSMAVLEAMAAGCAVVATVSPQSNARLLAQGRGIAIAPGSAAEIGSALVRLCRDPSLCYQMGQMAREYISNYHTPLMLKRSLLRASFFAPQIKVGNTDEQKTL